MWFSRGKADCFIGKTFMAPDRRCWNQESRCCVSSSTTYPPCGSVLDVGCGAGACGPALIAAGHRWTGLEVNPDCLQLLEQSGLPFRHATRGTERFPCTDEEFDEAI